MKNKHVLILQLLLLMFWNCSTESIKESARNRIAILNDTSAGIDVSIVDAVADALRREKFEVEFLTAEEICDTAILSTQNTFLYVIPDAKSYPAEGEIALRKYLRGKGNLLTLGSSPLPGQPLIETVSPAYKLYPVSDVAMLRVNQNQGIFSDDGTELPVPVNASSCFRRPTGKGFKCGYSFRWIPIISAHDKKGLERGTVAWMLVNQAPLERGPDFNDALRRLIATTEGNKSNEPVVAEGSVIGACAISDPAVLKKLSETHLFGNMARQMARGVYLSHAGAREFSYWPGETMQFGAAVVNYGEKATKVEVMITVSSQADSELVFKKKMKLTVKSGETLGKVFGEMPAESRSGGYLVKTELISQGKTIDMISYEVGILSTEKVAKDEFVTTCGTDFYLKGEKWYPVGVNYWPRSAMAAEQVDYLYHWLTPGWYDPEQVDDDLQRLQDMGANFVAIRAHYIENRRTVLDFLRRCHNHGIYVFLFLQSHEITIEPHYFQGLMMPFLFEEEKIARFIEDTRIADNPAVMAWDMIWEPSVWLFKDNVTMFGWDGNPNLRQRWDKDWAEWINERYGNLSNAESDWGVPVPRTPDGQITSPSDQQFSEDGPDRIMVAAYRRFMNDLMNHHWNNAVQKLRKLDPNHLISYRQGNLPPEDFTLTSTLKHVDFFSMEGYNFRPIDNGPNTAGFINRYLCYAFENKPFMWNEYGYGGPRGKHTRHLDGEDIIYQMECVDIIHKEAYRNGANGIAPWWFPGGLRASEKTDYGIFTPEGTLRPSGESLKKYGVLYHSRPPERPVPDTWFTLDLDAHNGGLWYVTHNEGARAYEKAIASGKCLGVHTPGTGTTSVNVPLLAVGNTPYNGKNPPKYLNAEFNWLKIKIGDGEWIDVINDTQIQVLQNSKVIVKASVGNLQEATWLTPESSKGSPGAVYLSGTGNSDLKLKVPIMEDTPWQQNTDFGESFLITDKISGETRIELQMTADGRAWFGEKFRFTLVLKNN